MTNKKVRLYAKWIIAVLLVLLVGTVVWAQGPISMEIFFRAVGFRGPLYVFGQTMYLDSDSDSLLTLSVDDTVTMDLGGATEYDFSATSLDLNDNLLDQDVGVENIGGLTSVVTASVDSTMTTTTALVTISDGEIWYVDRAILQVTTNFDCTGDDCAVDIGDGSDADGLLNLADADLQAAATDYTGSPAGWQGLDGSVPAGAYLVGGPHIYAPSGADETIDVAVGGTDPAAGDGVLYLFYRRLE